VTAVSALAERLSVTEIPLVTGVRTNLFGLFATVATVMFCGTARYAERRRARADDHVAVGIRRDDEKVRRRRAEQRVTARRRGHVRLTRIGIRNDPVGTPSRVIETVLVWPETIVCATVFCESALPVPAGAVVGDEGERIVAERRIATSVQTGVAPKDGVEQSPPDGVRFCATGEAPLTLIVIDCVAGERYFGRRRVAWPVCGGRVDPNRNGHRGGRNRG